VVHHSGEKRGDLNKTVNLDAGREWRDSKNQENMRRTGVEKTYKRVHPAERAKTGKANGVVKKCCLTIEK